MTEQLYEKQMKNWHRDTPNAPVMPYNILIHKGTPMKIIAHTKYGVFHGVERDYDETEYKKVEKLLECLPKLEYFSFATDRSEIYMTKEMIADTLFILEK